MGVDRNRLMALLYLNPAWAEITSADIAVDVMFDPNLHQFIQNAPEDPRCAICTLTLD